jgi:hypothetical protein
MLKLFNKQYKAISNLLVTTIEEEHLVYPYPLSAIGTTYNESDNTQNQIEFRFSNYFDSILTLDYSFNLTFFLFTPLYRLEIMTVEQIVKAEDMADSYGYKGIFKFQDGALRMNIMAEDTYDKYKLFEKQYVEN